MERSTNRAYTVALPLGSGNITSPVSRCGSRYNALWDTGATYSSISMSVLKELGLTTTGKFRQLDSSNGSYLSPIYVVDIVLPNGIKCCGVKVHISYLKQCDVVIGMDVITLGDFRIWRDEDKVRFSFSIDVEE